MAKRTHNEGTNWTPAQVDELKGLAASGVPTSMIALQLGRSVTAIRSKAGAAGIHVSENIGGAPAVRGAERRAARR